MAHSFSTAHHLLPHAGTPKSVSTHLLLAECLPFARIFLTETRSFTKILYARLANTQNSEGHIAKRKQLVVAAVHSGEGFLINNFLINEDKQFHFPIKITDKNPLKEATFYCPSPFHTFPLHFSASSVAKPSPGRSGQRQWLTWLCSSSSRATTSVGVAMHINPLPTPTFNFQLSNNYNFYDINIISKRRHWPHNGPSGQ